MAEQKDITKTQRAWFIVRKGLPPKALELKKDAPVPTTLEKGQALVKVQAAALNPVGYKLMGLLPNFAAKRPHVAEHDLAGVIVDQKDTNLKVGEEVFGWIPVPEQQKTKQGALAEYAIVTADNVTARPPNVSAHDAAGLSLAGQTAIQGLLDAKLQDNQRVFINGGSSSVGGYAIQIAKAKGYTVVSSCSGRNIEYVKSLGADEVLDYTTSPIYSQLAEKYDSEDKKFHAIFDTVGLLNPNLYTNSHKYLANKGIFVTVGPYLTQPGESFLVQGIRTMWHSFLRPSFLGGTKAKFKITLVESNRENLETLQKLVAEGKVKPLVDSTYKFDDVLGAYERLMSGRAKGKVIVKVVDTDA